MARSKHISKQGISPLIATVLIIAFTVALAVIVINWGTSFTRDLQDNTGSSAEFEITCAQDVVFSVKSACVDKGSDTQLGTTDDSLKVTVANDGAKAIDQVIIRISSVNNGATQQYTTTGTAPLISPFGVNTVTIASQATDGTPLYPSGPAKVEVIPYVTVSDESQPCSSNKRTYGVETTALAAC